MKIGHKIIKNTDSIPMDLTHVMGITKFKNFDVKTIAHNYSPTTINCELLQKGIKTIKGFFGSDFKMDYLTLYFSKTTQDMILMIYSPTGDNSEPNDNDFVICIAPIKNSIVKGESLYDIEDLERLI